jgi:hypothetical protein
MVSICGQNGKPRSAMTSALVWRARQEREQLRVENSRLQHISFFDGGSNAS